MLVGDILRSSAAAAPDQIALAVDGGGDMTYARWEARSNALARALVERGIAPGDRVGLLYDNDGWLDYAVSYFAVSKAGGVAVPLSPRWARPELAHVIAHAGCRAVLTQEPLAATAREACEETPERVIEDLDAAAAGRAESTFQIDRSDDDLADISYTSGTTGTPKGVAAPHANLCFDHFAGSSPWSGQVFVHAIPATTFAGTYAMMLIPCQQRMTTVTLPRFVPERYAAVLEERRASVTYLVPAMARLLLDSGTAERHDLSSVRIVRFGTAPMPSTTLRHLAGVFPNAALINVYGLTEAGPAGTTMMFDEARPDSVGKPLGGARLRITDETGRDVPAGETGDVWLGLPDGLRGRVYYRDAEATGQTFRGGWVRTGDIGYLDAEGYLFVVDRAKDVVIRGGYKVSSLEVEAVMVQHPDVVEAAVVAVPHDVLGEDVAAFVVPRPGAAPDTASIEAFCRERLADYKVPRRLVFVDDLPRNALGKVLKRELRERLAAGEEALRT